MHVYVHVHAFDRSEKCQHVDASRVATCWSSSRHLSGRIPAILRTSSDLDESSDEIFLQFEYVFIPVGVCSSDEALTQLISTKFDKRNIFVTSK